MRIDVVGDAPCGFDASAAARAIDEFFEPTFLSGVSASGSVSLSFTSEDEIRALNEQYRDMDEPTDVLSFPLFEEGGLFVPPIGWEEVPLGDVVVAPAFVRREADEAGRPFERELAVVVFHGVLHLLGYDHDTDDRREEMWRAQDAIADAYLSSDFKELSME